MSGGGGFDVRPVTLAVPLGREHSQCHARSGGWRARRIRRDVGRLLSGSKVLASPRYGASIDEWSCDSFHSRSRVRGSRSVRGLTRWPMALARGGVQPARRCELRTRRARRLRAPPRRTSLNYAFSGISAQASSLRFSREVFGLLIVRVGRRGRGRAVPADGSGVACTARRLTLLEHRQHQQPRPCRLRDPARRSGS